VQLEGFCRGEIDAALMLHSPGFAPPGLERLTISEEPLVLALPAGHPLAKVDKLPLQAALAEPVVIFPRRIVPSLHDAIFALYHATGRTPQIAQEAIQMQTIVNLVWGGLGVAWVPRSVMQFRRTGVVYRTASEFEPSGRRRSAAPLPSCETSLVWPADADNPALARFVDFIRAQGVAPH
jgi:DNA-binding transcriptional LysR family regulator